MWVSVSMASITCLLCTFIHNKCLYYGTPSPPAPSCRLALSSSAQQQPATAAAAARPRGDVHLEALAATAGVRREEQEKELRERLQQGGWVGA